MCNNVFDRSWLAKKTVTNIGGQASKGGKNGMIMQPYIYIYIHIYIYINHLYHSISIYGMFAGSSEYSLACQHVPSLFAMRELRDIIKNQMSNGIEWLHSQFLVVVEVN